MIMQGLKSRDIKEVITFKVLEFVILAISDTATLVPYHQVNLLWQIWSVGTS